MGDRKEIKQTIVFIGFLILSGVCYLFTGTDSLFLNTVMFSANFLIYAGLLLYWIQSVRTRLLPTTARAYILAAAFLMLFCDDPDAVSDDLHPDAPRRTRE